MSDHASIDEVFMSRALELAQQAAVQGEVPVGAVVVLDGEIIGEGFNNPISSCDPTAHAEVVALRNAAKRVDNYRLLNATLYVTIEPCTMCAGAIIHARIQRLVYGAPEPKAGIISSNGCVFEQDYFNHHVEFTAGILADQCAGVMADFFKARRNS